MSLITKFIDEYKIKANQLIKKAEECRIVKPWGKEKFVSPHLTSREKEVAQLLTYSLTAREIANRLSLKTRTIEGYIDKIKDKYLCAGS